MTIGLRTEQLRKGTTRSIERDADSFKNECDGCAAGQASVTLRRIPGRPRLTLMVYSGTGPFRESQSAEPVLGLRGGRHGLLLNLNNTARTASVKMCPQMRHRYRFLSPAGLSNLSSQVRVIRRSFLEWHIGQLRSVDFGITLSFCRA
jgi:hypothetical protein